MGYLHELMPNFTMPTFCRAKPGPVRRLYAGTNSHGRLFLHWLPPAGGRADFYRIERTRDGQAYELVAELKGIWFCLADAPLHEPWFYRVVAVNARGIGRAKCVWFFQRAGNGKSRLLLVPAIPGLVVNICE
ncbi:MAG: fibronectin type III domain-containing protein [Verrucomicrobiales bacterium]|nr:fibronectin type III domain-containing protein [Verrucomicrobiales bacterium]